MKSIFFKTGDFIQKIIIKNITLFVTLGFIKWAALYFSDFSFLGNLFAEYIIPFSIGYSTGNTADKKHGGVIGAAGAGILIYADAGENLLEIIFISFLMSTSTKFFKEKIISKTVPGFEMFFTNVGVPAIILGYYFILLKTIPYINNFFTICSNIILGINNGIWGIIVATIFIEISKVFFINNFINHGILALAGYNEIIEKESSLLFLLETNPGAGLGILLAYYFISKNKKNISTDIVVEFFGGIHEIYFPYVLKKLKLLMALICGGIAGNLFFYYFNITLSTVPSPGSIIIITILSASSKFLLLTGVLLSAVISFGIAYIILSLDKKEEKIENKNNTETVNKEDILKIFILCNGGMGTSHIGKTFLENIIKEKNIKNTEIYSSFLGDNIDSAKIVITHNNFKENAEKLYPGKIIVGLENYMDKNFYLEFTKKYLIKNISQENKNIETKKTEKEVPLKIELGLKSVSEDEAVKYMKNFLNIKSENKVFLKNGILVLYSDDFTLPLKTAVHQYPYGIKNSEKNLFLIMGICTENKEKINSAVRYLEKISLDNIIMSDLEISDDQRIFENIFSIKKLFEKEEKYAE